MAIHIPASMYRDGTVQELTPEQEENKKYLYESLTPRRKKFIDRVGYDNWDPFPKPNDPFELRTDITKRSAQQLMHEFKKSMKSKPLIPGCETGALFEQATLEMALGLINKDEKYLGFFEFSVWYYELLKKEQHINL